MLKHILVVFLRKHLIIVIISLVNTCHVFSQTTITLQPGPEEGKDVLIDSRFPDENFGNSKSFRATLWGYEVRSLIDFNISEIPPNAEILSAYLSLYAYYNEPNNEFHYGILSVWSMLRRIITPWDEFTVNWNNQPFQTHENVIGLPTPQDPLQDYLDIDATNLIKDMIKYPQNSYGFVLRTYYSFGPYRASFVSSDHENPDVHPKLVITFFIPPPTADFGYLKNDLVVYFTNLSLSATTYTWDFGDGIGSTEENPVHTYTDYAEYLVTLIASNDSTSDTSSQIINVCLGPNADFEYDIDEYQIVLTNKSLNADYYFWDFGDGNSSTSENPIYSYNEDGEYELTLIAQNNCSSDTTKTLINICIPPTANFDYYLDGFEISFINNSIKYDSCVWYFGDGSGSVLNDPVHTYNDEDDYQVTLIALNECGSDTINETIQVYAIEKLDKNELIRIFPNPAQDVIFIQFTNLNKQKITLEIFNLHGQRILQLDQKSIDNDQIIDLNLSSQPEGIYFLKIQLEDRLYTYKLVLIRNE